MSGRLRWKRRTKPTGLARIGCGPMGSDYTDGKMELASTWPLSGRSSWEIVGWYFVGRVGSAHENTFRKPAHDEDTAKRQAVEWVRARLNEQPNPPATPDPQAQ